MPEQDHAEIHELAAQQHEDHPEALGDSTADESVEEKLAKLDQRLTGRINELRKDFGATKQATSESVRKLSDSLDSLKTSVENNTASIEAQNNAIEIAEHKAEDAAKKADAAKQAADAAGQSAAKAQDTANKATERITATEQSLSDLANVYATHTHPVTISLSGETDPPQATGGAA